MRVGQSVVWIPGTDSLWGDRNNNKLETFCTTLRQRVISRGQQRSGIVSRRSQMVETSSGMRVIRCIGSMRNDDRGCGRHSAADSRWLTLYRNSSFCCLQCITQANRIIDHSSSLHIHCDNYSSYTLYILSNYTRITQDSYKTINISKSRPNVRL